MKYIAYDISNLLHRCFYANRGESDDTVIAGMAHHVALTTLNKYYKKYNPDKIIMCFDRPNWRKTHTALDTTISPKVYKANRQQMTESQKAKRKLFMEHLTEFENLMREHTSVICLAADELEADDLMAGVCQTLCHDNSNEVVLISADKDMIQLLEYPTVQLVDPATGDHRTLDDWGGSPELFMFEKCLRGDTGDNVQSAYPRIRKAKILKAFEDEFEKANIMKHKWTHANGNEYVVEDLYAEGRLLMDLHAQPERIQVLIIETVLENLKNPGSFNYFKFMQFCGEYNLIKITENADKYINMLSS